MSSLMFDPKSMAAVAAGMSRSRGVKVTCSGRGAYTTCASRMAPDGRMVRELAINIPAEVLESKADAAALLRGYLDHEAAHVRWTDWNVLEDGRWKDPMLKTLLNIVEDVRVEKRMSAAFRGAGENLARIADILFGGDGWKEHARPGQPAALAASWLLFSLRSKAQPSLEKGAAVLGDLLDATVPGVREAMQSVLDHAFEPESTADAAAIAYDLWKAMSSTGRPEDGASPEERHEAAEKAKQSMKDAGMRASTAKSVAGKAERNEESAGTAGYRFDKGDVPFGAGGMADAVNRELDMGNAEQCASFDAGNANPSGVFVPREKAMTDLVHGFRRLRPRTQSERDASASVCAGLGQRLRSLLQTQSSVRRSVRASGTRLDSRSLWRAGASDGRVFAGRSQGRTVDTELIMLVDVSGSMGRDSGDFGRIRMANAAMAGVLSALEQVKGVYAGAFTFSKPYAGTLEHVAVKWPRERLSAAALPWACEAGATDIAGSMKACAGAFTPEAPRKIMIVVSDGDDGAQDLQDAERDLEAMGIEVAGVSVSVSDLVDGLRRCTYAAEPSEIPSAVFGAVQSLLLGSAS
jgi:uncharacterized protein with von Willebrand factor type A (vWA) domain